MRRGFFWTAVLVALSALIGGGAYAYVEYRATSGPDTTVRGYFAALARSDAPAALALGDLPHGPRTLLTSEVLRQQQRIAALHDARITDTVLAGNEATVRYSYRLRFARRDDEATGTLHLVHRPAGWRLTQTAVRVTVRLVQARDRVTFAGSNVPDAPTLLFPGALPLQFDTPYLQVEPATATAQFAGGGTINVRLDPSPAARTALTKALAKTIRACVGAGAAPSCPLPSSRIVPASLHGRIAAPGRKRIDFRVGSEASGTITMTGTLVFHGRYRRLDYQNVAHTHTGRLVLRIEASAYPVAPLTLRLGTGT